MGSTDPFGCSEVGVSLAHMLRDSLSLKVRGVKTELCWLLEGTNTKPATDAVQGLQC